MVTRPGDGPVGHWRHDGRPRTWRGCQRADSRTNSRGKRSKGFYEKRRGAPQPPEPNLDEDGLCSFDSAKASSRQSLRSDVYAMEGIPLPLRSYFACFKAGGVPQINLP